MTNEIIELLEQSEYGIIAINEPNIFLDVCLPAEGCASDVAIWYDDNKKCKAISIYKVDYADIAKRNLSLMGTKKGNIVRTIAIFAKDLGVMKIKNKSCENEKKYYGTMIVAYQLLKQKIITTEEFKQIGELFQNKYKISSPLLINISLRQKI